MGVGIATPWGANKPPLGWTANPNAAADLGLSLAYLFNEAGGFTAFDVLGSANLGVISTDATLWTASSLGGGLSFAGNTHVCDVVLPQAAVNNIPSGFIAAWCNFTSVGNGGFLFTRQHDGTGTYAAFGVGCYIDSGGSRQTGVAGTLYWHGNNGVTQAASTSTIVTGLLYHLAVVFTGSAATFYINGQAAGTTSANYSIPNDASATNCVIGGFVTSGSYDFTSGLNATLDCLMVGTLAPTADQIARLAGQSGNPFFWMQPQPRRTWFTAPAGAAFLVGGLNIGQAVKRASIF